jgi:hypothetical protein
MEFFQFYITEFVFVVSESVDIFPQKIIMQVLRRFQFFRNLAVLI